MDFWKVNRPQQFPLSNRSGLFNFVSSINKYPDERHKRNQQFSHADSFHGTGVMPRSLGVILVVFGYDMLSSRCFHKPISINPTNGFVVSKVARIFLVKRNKN